MLEPGATEWSCAERLAREWSFKGQKFTEDDFSNVVRDFDPNRGTGLATLVHIAREHGYNGPGLGGDGRVPAHGDIINGRRFAAELRDRLLYIHDSNEWLKFDPAGGWLSAPMVEVEAAAKVIVDAMSHEAAKRWRQSPDNAAAKRLFNTSSAPAAFQHMRAMIEMAKSEPGMSASLADFDADPMLLGVENGVLDLRTGTLRPFSPDQRVSKRCGVAFDPGADCPRFEDVPARRFCRTRTYEPSCADGSATCLTGSVDEQVFAFLYGRGFNGKSVLIELLGWLLGDYARKIPTEMLMQQQRSAQGPDPDILLLKGLRLAFANETEDGRRPVRGADQGHDRRRHTDRPGPLCESAPSASTRRSS